MQETYARKEAAEALGIGLRTLYNWCKAAGILFEDAEGYAPLTRAEVELLAQQHKRVLKELQPRSDPISLAMRITQLEQQVQGLQEQVNALNRLLIAHLAAPLPPPSTDTTPRPIPLSDVPSENG